MSELQRLEKIENISSNERLIKIVSMEKIYNGIYMAQYVIALQNGKGGYIIQTVNDVEEYVCKMDNPYRKTVVDTSVIPIETIEKWAKSAFINVDINIEKNIRGKYSLKLTGVSDNGVLFEGWIDIKTWELKSLYPIKEER